MKNITIDQIINTQYKQFSYYVIEQRAIPSIIDGLKPVMRRSLWVGKKLAKDWVKVSKLAGATMSLHPHGNVSIEDSISSSAQRFAGANNITWFEGKGGFGSRLSGPGEGIAAARYVAVKLTDSFHNIMDADSDLVEVISNYDDTDKEPKTFLPIIPVVLVNPIQGIAVGFSCNILPRKLEDIVHCQKQHLQGKAFREPKVHFEGFKGTIEKGETPDTWVTTGVFERCGKKKLVIKELPIGYNRESYIKVLDKLEESEKISSFVDECTENFQFSVTLKIEVETDDELLELFKLKTNLNENINVIGFDGKIKKMTVTEIIKEFTDYRFGFYSKRYRKMFDQEKQQFEYDRDLLKIISKNLFKKFPDMKKEEITTFLIQEGINELHIPKIIQTPIYRFSKDEIDILREKLNAAKERIEKLVALCKSEELRKDEYIKELGKI